MQGQGGMHMHGGGMPGPMPGVVHNGGPMNMHPPGPGMGHPGHYQGGAPGGGGGVHEPPQGSSASRSVFVGNIPYTASEDQLLEVFETAGPVYNLRLEKQDGQLKGFGFCEFRDVESAERAIRNLNNYEMNGRLLRVDYASENLDKRSGGPSLAQLAGSGPGGQEADGQANQGEGAKPRGATGGGPMDAIASTVNNMTATQMYEVMGQLRHIVSTNKEQAKQLLMRDPQLCGQFLRMQERLNMLGNIQLPPPKPQAAPPPQAIPTPHLRPQSQQPVPSQPPHPHVPPPQPPLHGAPTPPMHSHVDPRQGPPPSAQPGPPYNQQYPPPDPRGAPPGQYRQPGPPFRPPQPNAAPPHMHQPHDPRRPGPSAPLNMPPQAAPGRHPPPQQPHPAPHPNQGPPPGQQPPGAGGAGGGALETIIANLSEQQLSQLKMLMQLPPQKLDEMQISAHQRALIDKLRVQFQGR